MQEETNLSAEQQRALSALLTLPTRAQAAHACDLSEVTLQRWMQEETFHRAYLAAQHDRLAATVAEAVRGAHSAVQTLHQIARSASEPTAARISAARALLDLAFEGMQLQDLLQRLEEVEHTLAAQKQG